MTNLVNVLVSMFGPRNSAQNDILTYAKTEYKNPDRPSLGMVRQAVETFLGRRKDDVPGYSMKDIAGAAAVTDIGRSLVSRFEDDPFTYTLTVPNTNQSK